MGAQGPLIKGTTVGSRLEPTPLAETLFSLLQGASLWLREGLFFKGFGAYLVTSKAHGQGWRPSFGGATSWLISKGPSSLHSRDTWFGTEQYRKEKARGSRPPILKHLHLS